MPGVLNQKKLTKQFGWTREISLGGIGVQGVDE